MNGIRVGRDGIRSGGGEVKAGGMGLIKGCLWVDVGGGFITVCCSLFLGFSSRMKHYHARKQRSIVPDIGLIFCSTKELSANRYPCQEEPC
jgi:hypothetical protein